MGIDRFGKMFKEEPTLFPNLVMGIFPESARSPFPESVAFFLNQILRFFPNLLPYIFPDFVVFSWKPFWLRFPNRLYFFPNLVTSIFPESAPLPFPESVAFFPNQVLLFFPESALVVFPEIGSVPTYLNPVTFPPWKLLFLFSQKQSRFSWMFFVPRSCFLCFLLNSFFLNQMLLVFPNLLPHIFPDFVVFPACHSGFVSRIASSRIWWPLFLPNLFFSPFPNRPLSR